MKIINDALDAMHQVFENMRQHNDWLQETNQVFENTRQHNDRLQETNQVLENTREDNELRGPLIWHASMWMENIYFIRHADYGMHLAFMVVGTFTYLPQHSVRGKNVAPMAACHLPVRTSTRN